MNWAMPWAPAGEPALRSKPDSAISWLAIKAGGTPQCAAERRIGSRYCAGTNAGRLVEAAFDAARPAAGRASPAGEHGAGPASKPKCQASHEYLWTKRNRRALEASHE